MDKKGNIAVDDNILVKDVLSTAGSHILDGFTPLFSAEAVTRLENKGYKISGKANVGEFGLDLLGETSYYGALAEDGKIKNAAAQVVASGEVEAALCVDLGGSPRRAAAVENVTFLKPTYSTVSRYGVIACMCSAEQIGVMAKDAKKVAEVMSVIAGHDDKDGTSDPKEAYDYSLTEDIKGKKACIIKELLDAADDAVKVKVLAYKKKLEALGITVEEVSFGLIPAAQSAWQILLSAETCNNLSKFDGVKYGYRTSNFKNIDDIYVNTRTEGLGLLAKSVILYGSDVLSKGRYEVCYDKAMRVRRVVTESFKKIFENYDLVLSPATSTDSYAQYDLNDAFDKVFSESKYTVLASLSGTPALVTSGIQLLADAFNENILLSAANAVEEV
ncbi:MAG: hypothetical protein IJD45_06575 [Clostridia bacterium]|nr:hypothetical protein [Clostridia bacterium]